MASTNRWPIRTIGKKIAFGNGEVPGSPPWPKKVVLKIKQNGTCTIVAFKARIVHGGDSQTYENDYLETNAPVFAIYVVMVTL